MLIAQIDILYGFKTYRAGEELPDCEMKEAWIECGSAVEVEKEEPKRKAIPVAAQAGITGTVDGAATQDETPVGVVKKTRKRATT